MPELMDGAILVGICAALAARLLTGRRDGKRRVPVFAAVLIGGAAAYLVPPVLAWGKDIWRATPGLPEITGGAVFLGVWFAAVALFLFERKGQPRRVPLWAGLVVGVTAALAVPPLVDWATGSYQAASLRSDVDVCTEGMRGEVQPRAVTNICDFPIIVGLCLPGEVNPAPCRQSMEIAPGETALFDPGDARLSSVPGNPNGLTVVACRPSHRPSRMSNVTGRGHRGVCLPAG